MLDAIDISLILHLKLLTKRDTLSTQVGLDPTAYKPQYSKWRVAVCFARDDHHVRLCVSTARTKDLRLPFCVRVLDVLKAARWLNVHFR